VTGLCGSVIWFAELPAFIIHELQALTEQTALDNFQIHWHQCFFRMISETRNEGNK
jgi:hypothetical protein